MAKNFYPNSEMNEALLMNDEGSFISSPDEMVEMIQQITDTYKFFPNNIYLREANCVKIQWKAFMQNVAPNDLFVGLTHQPPIGFVPQSDEGRLGYYLHPLALEKLLNNKQLSSNRKIQLEKLIEFWKTNNTVQQSLNAFDPEMKEILTSDRYWAESGITFILWRMSGIQMDYEKLVRLGIPGLRNEIADFQKKVKKDSA